MESQEVNNTNEGKFLSEGPKKENIKAVVSNLSVDNESGYEDGVSDVNDTLNDSVDTSDITDSTISVSKENENIDSLIEKTSALMLDFSTRLVLWQFFSEFFKTFHPLFNDNLRLITLSVN